jgi:hypothetical protein
LEQNRQEFTGELFGSISRHLGGLINNRERLNYAEARELLKGF